jgi:CHAT domain-containing protein/Tfp pilus assembly protein PilF
LIHPHNWRTYFSAACLLVFAMGIPGYGQAARGTNVASANAAPPLLPGVVVEKVSKKSGAEKAGLREGDVLLGWSRGDEYGKIESPFDIPWLDIEQRPRGKVTITGTRGSQQMSWEMGAVFWYLNVRPNLTNNLLARYNSAQRLSKASQLPQSAAQFVVAANSAYISQSLRVWLLMKAADNLSTAGKWQQVDGIYRQILQESRDGQIKIQMYILVKWGDSYLTRSNWSKADEYYQQALSLGLPLIAGNLSVASIFERLGSLNLQNEEPTLAEDFFSKGLQIQEKLIPGQLDTATMLDALAAAAAEAGDLKRAEMYLLQSSPIEDKFVPDTAWMARNLYTQGMVAFYQSDFAKSAANYLHALSIERNSKNARDTSYTLDALGVLSWYRGDLASSEGYLHQALEIKRKIEPNSLSLANSLINFAVTVRDNGDPQTAETYLNQALSIAFKLSPHSRIVSRGYDNIGVIALQHNDLTRAEEYILKSLIIEQQIAPASFYIADRLNDLGSVFVKHGELAKGIEYYRRAEEVDPGGIIHAETLAEMAAIFRRQRKLNLADDYYLRSIGELENQSIRLGGSVETRTGFRAKHSAYYRDYVDLLVFLGKPRLAYDILERSRARALLEMMAAAHIDVRKGVDPSLLEREHSLRADINAKSERRIQLMGEKQSDQAVKVVEKEIADLSSQYQDVEEQIRATSPAYAALTQPQPLTAKEVQTQILDPNTLLLEYSLGEDRSYVFAVTPDSLQAFELPKRAEVEKTARRVYSLLTARNRTVNGETPIQQQARLARAKAEYPNAAAELSKMILGPVAAQLQNKRLLIVSDGALAYISFSTLPEPVSADAETASAASQAAEPLIVNHEIVNLPSASVLAVLRQQEQGRKPAPNAVAVVADPVFDRSDPRVAATGKTLTASARAVPQTRSGQISDKKKEATKNPSEASLIEAPSSAGLLTRSATDIGLSRNGQLRLPRLRFTRKEADEIMAVTPEGMGKKAVDFDATRAMATSPELSQYRIVHFATHGLLDSAHPELSGLVFSMVDKNGRPQNGFLELQDIYNLNLPADLVVLSACETGLGKEISGEGLVGLTRGFMYAGASRVVASLWRVSDVGTAELMGAFYTAMEKDGLPPAAALRTAQIKLWKQKRWSDPYYWAAFQIQGEWK